MLILLFPYCERYGKKIVDGWFSFPIRRVARQCRETMTMTTLARLFCERVQMYVTGKVHPTRHNMLMFCAAARVMDALPF